MRDTKTKGLPAEDDVAREETLLSEISKALGHNRHQVKEKVPYICFGEIDFRSHAITAAVDSRFAFRQSASQHHCCNFEDNWCEFTNSGYSAAVHALSSHGVLSIDCAVISSDLPLATALAAN